MSSFNPKVAVYVPLLLSAGIGSAPAIAQDEKDIVQLDPIYIAGEEDEPLKNIEGYTAEAAGTAVRGLPGDLKTTPRSVTVINENQIEDQGARTIEEAIAYTPGVSIENYGQDGRYDQYAIRGFSSNTSSLYRDGMPLRTYGWGAWRTELWGTDRIEVLRGATADLYGANQPGGLVNAITKRPLFEQFSQARATLFGYGGAEVAFDVTGPLSDTFAYRFVGLYNDSGTVFDDVDEGRIYLAPSVTWQPTDRTKLNIFAQYQKDDVPDSYVIVPEYGSLRFNPVAEYTNSTYSNDPNQNTITSTQSYIGYEFEHAFENGLTFRSRARISRNDWLNDTVYAGNFFSSSGVADAIDSATLTEFYVDQTVDETSLDNALSYQFSTGQVEATVIGGIDYYQSDYDNYYGFGYGGTKNLLTGVVTRAPSNLGYIDEDQTIRQLGIYASGVANIGDNIVLTAGLRHDKVKRDLTTTYEAYNITVDQNAEDSFTSASLGLSYNFDNGATVYGNAARSFDLPPSGTDVDGNQMKVEEANSYEIGARFRPNGTNSLFSVALFQIDKTNTTQSIPGTLFVEQTGAVRSRGAELSANHRFNNGLSVLAQYTYIDAHFRNDVLYGNNEVPRVPQHEAAIWLSYDVPSLEGLTLGGGARYIGSRFSDSENLAEFALGSATLFDLSVSYERNGWRYLLTGRNIADKQYVTYCFGTEGAYSNGCAFGAGRSVEFSVSKTF